MFWYRYRYAKSSLCQMSIELGKNLNMEEMIKKYEGDQNHSGGRFWQVFKLRISPFTYPSWVTFGTAVKK